MEQEFFCFGRFGSQGSKENFFLNILASALKSYKEWLLYIFFLKKFEKIEKIGYPSNFNFEGNKERGFKDSLSIALGINPFLYMNDQFALII